MKGEIDKRFRASRIGLTMIVLATTLAVSAAGSLAASRPGINLLPTPEEIPASTVAIVSHVPFRLRTISTADLSRAMRQYAAVELDLKSAPKPGQARYKAVEEAALGEQFDRIWIQGQVAEMKITATKREVHTELARIKRENFKSLKQYYAYLRHSHYTRRDVLGRVKIQILAMKIEERFPPGKFSKFVDTYMRRWTSRTVCAPRYAIKRCSNSAATG